jgi:transposase
LKSARGIKVLACREIVHPSFTREFEYKRTTARSACWPATGKVHALVEDRHRSREFIAFLKLIDAAYPNHTAIRLILDNHSAHISKETKAWLANRPAGRFEFTFTPKHGSWLNLVEGFFSKLARSVLRHIRVASKHELKDRIMAAMDHFNERPVVHTVRIRPAPRAGAADLRWRSGGSRLGLSGRLPIPRE